MTRKPTSAKTWQDLADATGLSEDTVKACIRTHELPGYVIGRKYVIPLQAFEDFCAGTWAQPTKPVLDEPVRLRRVG